MTTATRISVPILLVALALFHLTASPANAAAIETPKGKKIPGRIVEEGDEQFKIETVLPSGGKIIFNVNKDKVDPYGTVPGKGRIEDIKGKVEIKKAGRDFFTKAMKSMPVYPGDEIRTGPNSKVVVTLETTAVNGIGPESQFVLENFEKNPETKMVDIKVGLPGGKLWSEVGRLKTKDSRFQVETPTAVTGVRGTVFHVEVEKDTAETSVSVLSGRVGVSSTAAPAKEVILDKGEALFIKRDKEPNKYGPKEIIIRIARMARAWAEESNYFGSVTALAGIGQIEEISLPPGVTPDKKRLIYDAIQAGWEKASEDMFQMDKALKLFYLDFGRFPSQEEGGLKALIRSTGTPQWNGPYIEEDFLVDHYGIPYSYKVLRDAHGSVYAEITTFGYDKIPGTKDDRRKMVLEEDARRWEDSKGYR